jgi:PEP-CTERM motif
MNKFQRVMTGAVLLAISGASSANLVFNFTFIAGTSAQAIQGFNDAAARWSNVLTDNVTLDMTVGTASLGAGILASFGSRNTSFSYSSFYSALNADQSSASDATAVGSLGAGPSFAMLINRTADNPNGAGSATTYVDATGANNNTIRLTTANAKALGLAVGTGTVGACAATCDASITFSNAFAYDFNPNNGITAGQLDFVGIATNQIGRALGFASGVDILDINSPPVNGPFTADQFTFVNSLDLFRYSAASAAQGVIDFSADTRSKYFSIDGGATNIANFSTGRNFGDGHQAGHWKDNLGLGIMDPTAAFGELLAISANDIQAFDVIGWNLADVNNSVPEPSALALVGLSLAGLAFSRRRRAALA